MVETSRVPGQTATTSDGPSFTEALTIWTFGGFDRNGQRYDELWRGAYAGDSEERSYRFRSIQASPSPSAREGATLLSDIRNQRLILFGGLSEQGLLGDLWTYSIDNQAWAHQSLDIPSGLGRVGVAALVVGNMAYLFGGQSEAGSDERLWRLELESLRFEPVTDGQLEGPGPRFEASLAMDAVDEVLYLYGGRSLDGSWRNDLWAFNLHRRTWQRIADDCSPGDDCPPPARGSALQSSGTPGAVTLALGTPVVEWDRSEHEWRYLLSQRRWYPEEELRGEWDVVEPPTPPPWWCLATAVGSRAKSPDTVLYMFMLVVALLLIRRSRQRG